MRMYTSSRAKRKHFHRKIESQMFLFISGRHIGVHDVHQYGVSIQSSLKLRETFLVFIIPSTHLIFLIVVNIKNVFYFFFVLLQISIRPLKHVNCFNY